MDLFEEGCHTILTIYLISRTHRCINKQDNNEIRNFIIRRMLKNVYNTSCFGNAFRTLILQILAMHSNSNVLFYRLDLRLHKLLLLHTCKI